MSPRPLPCDEARALLDEALDGSLPGAAREDLDAHLAACASCRSEARAAERVHGLLGAPLPGPGPGFTESVVAALDRGPRRAPPVPPAVRALRVAASLAATGAVAALALLVLPESAAAAGLDALLPPALGAALPPVPPEAGDLLARAGTLLTPGAAAGAAAAAAALLFLELAAARRRSPRGGGR